MFDPNNNQPQMPIDDQPAPTVTPTVQDRLEIKI